MTRVKVKERNAAIRQRFDVLTGPAVGLPRARPAFGSRKITG